MPSSFTGSAADANVTKIARFRVYDDPPALIAPIYTATSSWINILFPSRRMLGSNIPGHCRNVAAMDPQCTIEKPNVRNTHLPTCMQPGCATQDSKLRGTCSRTKLLPGSSLSINTCTGLTPNVSVLLETVVLRASLLLIDVASFRNRLPCLATTLISQTCSKFALWMSQHAVSLLPNPSVPPLPPWVLWNCGGPGSSCIRMNLCVEIIVTNLCSKSWGACYLHWRYANLDVRTKN